MQLVTICLVCLAASSMFQSSQAQAGGIQESLQAVLAIAEHVSSESRTTRQPVDLERLAAAQAAEARLRVAGLDVTAVPTHDLLALANLYLFAGAPEQGRLMFKRYLREAHLTSAERAEITLTSLVAALTTVKTPAAEAFVEQLLQELDVQSDPPSVEAATMGHYHATLYYRETRIDEVRIEHHASAFLRRFSKLTPAAHAKLLPMALNVHVNFAWVLAGRGDTAEAISLLSHAVAIGGNVAGADAFLTTQLKTIGLIGQPAPPVQSDVWLNAPVNAGSTTLRERPHLIMFTAHWCRPCVPMYQLLNELMRTYAKRGLVPVLVTRVWGFFPHAPRDSTPLQEVEFDRQYFVTEHSIAFPIAIETTLYERGASPNERAYGVIGYPRLVLVGADGVIQRMWHGWDRRNEPVLRQSIERLLGK